jgi:hypothetical protein
MSMALSFKTLGTKRAHSLCKLEQFWKMILKPKILERVSAKCENFWNSNMTIICIMMTPYHRCITKQLIVNIVHG